MPTPFSDSLTADHRRCDQLLARVEESAQQADWPRAMQDAETFIAATDRHFQFEENTLFPPLESVMPGAIGPTSVMRQEHQMIRQLLTDLAAATSNQDLDDCLGVIQTLHMVLQQHNIKEEGVLYPAADRDLAADAERLLAALAD